MIKGVDFHWFPLDNPGIVAIPLSFLLGRRGHVDRRAAPAAGRRALHAAMEVRALTGAGAEPPPADSRHGESRISTTVSRGACHAESRALVAAMSGLGPGWLTRA